MRLISAWILIGLAAGSGCQRDGTAGRASADNANALDLRASRVNAALADTSAGEDTGKPIARWLLPADLAEISGLAITSDGRLFTHNDETARISEIDYRKGTITKHFFVGEKNLHADFEGLAYAHDRFYMLASNGIIYEFPEGAQGERVDCTVHDTQLGKECEFEGIAYDSAANVFVLACKNVGKKNVKDDELVLYRYTLGAEGEGQATQVAVPQAELIGRHDWKQLRPTDITVDPSTGNYVLVASQEKALFAVTPSGTPVLSRPLQGQHPQPEGVAITSDRILIISDESTNSAATITLYRWRGAPE
jgi:uncharacterized protein YjiK